MERIAINCVVLWREKDPALIVHAHQRSNRRCPTSLRIAWDRPLGDDNYTSQTRGVSARLAAFICTLQAPLSLFIYLFFILISTLRLCIVNITHVYTYFFYHHHLNMGWIIRLQLYCWFKRKQFNDYWIIYI